MNRPECNAGLIKAEPRKERDGREYTEFRCLKYRRKYMDIKIPRSMVGLQEGI